MGCRVAAEQGGGLPPRDGAGEKLSGKTAPPSTPPPPPSASFITPGYYTRSLKKRTVLSYLDIDIMYRGRQRERRARGRIGCESLREKESGGRGSREGLREGERHPFSNKAATLHTFASDQAEFRSSSKKRENAYTENGEGRGRGKEGSSLTALSLFVKYSSASLMTTFLASADR